MVEKKLLFAVLVTILLAGLVMFCNACSPVAPSQHQMCAQMTGPGQMHLSSVAAGTCPDDPAQHKF